VQSLWLRRLLGQLFFAQLVFGLGRLGKGIAHE
jgi:hypothetical protein